VSTMAPKRERKENPSNLTHTRERLTRGSIRRDGSFGENGDKLKRVLFIGQVVLEVKESRRDDKKPIQKKLQSVRRRKWEITHFG